MGTQNGSKLEILPERILIHAFESKLRPFEVFPYVCIGSHAFAMFSAHALREKRGIPAHTNVTTFTYFGQNWSIDCLLCMALLSIQLCGGFGHFFLLSVQVALKKKKKKMSYYRSRCNLYHMKQFSYTLASTTCNQVV